ncbi:MAG: ATP-binding protein [Saprospiraceae bacterium]
MRLFGNTFRNWKLVQLVLLVLLFVYVHVSAQSTYYNESSGYISSLTYFSDLDGLPHREVLSIFQDRRGFIWLTTPNGLCRYDGTEFRKWNNDKDLHSKVDRILGEDSEGYLWLISEEFGELLAITLIHTTSLEIVPFSHLINESAEFLPQGGLANVLTGPDSTLYYVNKKSELIAYHHKRGFSKVQLGCRHNPNPAFFSGSDRFWTSNYEDSPVDSTHLIEFFTSGKKLRSLDIKGFTSHSRMFLQDGKLCFFVKYKDQVGQFFQLNADNQISSIPFSAFGLPSDITLPGKGYLYLRPNQLNHTILALRYEHPFIFEPGKGIVNDLWSSFPIMRADNVMGERGFYVDNKGRFWLGGDFGLYVLEYKKNPFTRFLNLPLQKFEQKGMPCRSICLFDNSIVVGTEANGVFEFSPESNTVRRRNTGKFNWCVGLYQTKDKRYKCYGFLKGLLVEDAVSGSSVSTNNERIDLKGAAECFLEISPHQLLVGYTIGLGSYDLLEKSARDYDKYNGFANLGKSSINHLYRDNSGDIWVCSSKGLFVLNYDSGVKSYYGNQASGSKYLPFTSVQHLYDQGNGIFWLATDAGLLRWNRHDGTYRMFTVVEGLANNHIYAVYPDDYGNLWLSSDGGIIQFDSKSFKSRAFQEEDGITHHEFNRMSHFQASDGTIYFGGLNGVTAFNPKQFRNWSVREDAPMEITAFYQFEESSNQLLDKSAELIRSKTIVMKPGDRFFQLQVSLLNYNPGQRKRYAYKIEGFDKEWNEQTHNTIRLSRLPYGNYTLRVKGQEADGHWSENELQLKLRVIKPVYLQSWFLITLTLLLIAGIYWLYKFNLNRRLARQEAQKLRELDAMKSELYTNISHEFRTPLTVIQGMTGNINGHEKEKTLIQRNVNSLLQLVGQLLDLSKLDAGSLKLDFRRSDIIKFLQYLIESFYSSAEEKKIRLVFDSEVDSLVMDFDPARLQQVIYNLVSNAMKFTHERGQVLVLTKKLSIENRDVLQIQVKDTGIGIPAEKLPYIFDRFYQVDGSHTRKGEGTGIGLALTKQLVEMMQGNIRVQSMEGKGTSFEIELPVSVSAPLLAPDWDNLKKQEKITEAEIEPEETVYTDHDKPVLLVIEDSKDVALYIQSCVEKDYQVHFAYDGASGIRKAFDLIPDIVISDVMMPGKDGFEVTDVLKNDERSSHIPIILLTAKAGVESRVQGLKAGADAYLVKPFHKEELLLWMGNMVELRTQLQQRFANYSPVDKKEEDLSIDERFLRNLHQFVIAEIDNTELDAQSLGKQVHLGQAQIYRKIKALTGKTPALFIRAIRLERAKQLLQEGHLNVSEIAYAVGFTDPNYFSRVFSQEFGKAPSHFTEH